MQQKTQQETRQGTRQGTPDYHWQSAEIWADTSLAERLSLSLSTGGKNYNLYNDLARAVSSGQIAGRLAEMHRIAAGDVAIKGVGSLKKERLSDFLAAEPVAEFEPLPWGLQMEALADALRARGREIPAGYAVQLETVPACERDASGLPMFRSVLVPVSIPAAVTA